MEKNHSSFVLHKVIKFIQKYFHICYGAETKALVFSNRYFSFFGLLLANLQTSCASKLNELCLSCNFEA